MNDIAELKAEIADLQKRVASIEACEPVAAAFNAAAAAAAADEERRLQLEHDRARRSLITSLNHTRVAMPKNSDGRILFDKVLRQFPELAERGGSRGSQVGDEDPFNRFLAALCWIGQLGRLEEPNRRYAVSWWVDGGNDWLHSWGMPRKLQGGDFIIAAIAWGDVSYVVPDRGIGQAHWEFGLVAYPHSGKLPAPDAWKRVLTEGLLAPRRSRYAA